MLIRRPEEVEAQKMTMPGAERVQMRLLLGRRDGTPNFSMRLFDVEPGGHTPRHSHNYEHEVMIVAGQGEIVTSENNAAPTRPVRAGDVVFIQPNELHQFRNTGSDALRFVCLVPSSFDCGNEKMPTPGS